MPNEPLVLLVDDDPDILGSLRDFLAMMLPGTRVLSAASGEEGLRILQRHTPWVIVSDYRMPKMDGVEFLARSRRFAPKAARLMMSAYADPEVAARSIREADCAIVVTKPFQLEYFAGVVASLIRRETQAMTH